MTLERNKDRLVAQRKFYIANPKIPYFMFYRSPDLKISFLGSSFHFMQFPLWTQDGRSSLV